MAKTILVTGGTGTLGREVVRRLVADGHAVRLLSRRPRPADHLDPASPGGGASGLAGAAWFTGDLNTGEGVAAAVAGADTVVHCATELRGGDDNRTRHLIAAAQRAEVGHLAYISIVGVDRVPLGYYQVKLAVERMVEQSGPGWTVLRATQFHDLLALLFGALSRLPVVPVPAGVSDQPVDVREVADRLAGLSTGAPAGRVPDMGGPEVRDVRDLARSYLRAVGRRRALVPVWLPGRTFAGYRAGGHLAPAHADGRITFEEFLSERFPAHR